MFLRCLMLSSAFVVVFAFALAVVRPCKKTKTKTKKQKTKKTVGWYGPYEDINLKKAWERKRAKPGTVTPGLWHSEPTVYGVWQS